MRNKLFLISTLFLMCFAFAKAQRGARVAYIDMEYILDNVPEYQQASKELERKMDKWKQEIDAMKLEVEQMKDALNNERVLLTKELIEEKEEDIQIKEDELLQYQQKRFGPQGDFLLQKQQLIQPVQDQVFNEVQKIAAQRKYDFVVDAAEASMLYSAERHDISDDVLKAIGRTAKVKSKNTKQPKKQVEDEKDERYLNVQEAEAKEEKEEQKQAIIDEREKARLEKLRKRDSIKAARAAIMKQRRDSILEARQRRKDSILKARAEQRAAQQKKQNGGE